MKKPAQHLPGAFTLVELLAVIALVVILAVLVFPTPRRPRRSLLPKRAQIEIMQVTSAIQTYEADYGKFPVSSKAMNAAAASGQDFTFGTYGLPTGLKTPSGRYDVRALDSAGNPLGYQANNSEIIAVLLDMEFWPSAPTVPTINLGRVQNPHKTRYLNAAMSGNRSSPGVGSDGVYRDPWGQPYIITIDLNKDGKARDAFHREPGISADRNDTNILKRGLDGLVPSVVGGRTLYEASSTVMVWSAGPDKMVDPGPGTPANRGANKDNILSWK